MKRRLLLILIICMYSSSGSLWAAKIDLASARKAALNVYQCKLTILGHAPKESAGIVSEYKVKLNSIDVYYVFNMNTGGWVLLSADDRITPVLAFSDEGELDPSKTSPELKKVLESYTQQILHAITNDISAAPEIVQQWQQWLSGSFSPAEKGAKSVLPLTVSNWDQGKYYNMLCPDDPDGPDGKVWTGCVATAMAQVMYYYRYPLLGTGLHGYLSSYGYLSADFGSTTYQWEVMENSIGTLYNLPMAEIQYHCGVAVDMNYSPTGSGAYMGDAAQAMIDYFGYSPSLHLEYKDNYTDAQWSSMLRTELDGRHPVCYAGFGDPGGHAYVCDGYEGTEHFHFNWGWGGSGNGYFYVDGLDQTYSFPNNQQAIFGAVPATGYPYNCSGTKTLTAARGTFEDGSGPVSAYGNNKDCLWLIQPDIHVDHIILTFNRFDTENANDIVTVYDGASTTDSVLGVFSGSSIPQSISSTGEKMLVRFTSDGSVGAQGWFASYRSIYPVYCNVLTELTAPSGSLSDGSGPYPYNNSTQCRWRIAPPGATGITVNFSDFDMEGNDFVRIYDEVSGNTVATFYGSTLPNAVFVFTSKVFIIFMSDNYGTASGFNATYTSSSSGIAGDSPLSGLCVYPNPSTNYLVINSPCSNNGEINFKVFTPTGSQVIYDQCTPANGLINKKLDVSALPQGLYFLVIETQYSRQTVPFTKD